MARWVAIGAGVAIVALLGGTYVVTQQRTAAACAGSAIAGGAIGGPFTLVDGAGDTVTDADIVTEPTLIYFGYTFCPDVCPIDNARNAAAVDLLAEEGVSATPVFITVDPERDTTEVVGDYVENFHPKMVGLTGSAAQVADAARAYRVFYSKQEGDPEYYLVSHSVFTYLALPGAGVVDVFAREDTPEEVADRVACFAAA